MEQLQHLISQKDEIINSLGSEEFLIWNKEISKLLNRLKGKDGLIYDTLSILKSLKQAYKILL